MPPKPKFTRDQILQCALDIVRTEGEGALTARHLGEVMGTSSRPIFTLFDSMEDLLCALRGPALEVFGKACAGFDDYKPAFKKLGQNLVAFATEEPHLFRFLFVDAHGDPKTLDEWCVGQLGDEAAAAIVSEYGLDEDTAHLLFKEMWLHTFALCVLKATGAAVVTDQEVSDSMSRAFTGLLDLAKSGHLNDAGITPQRLS